MARLKFEIAGATAVAVELLCSIGSTRTIAFPAPASHVAQMEDRRKPTSEHWISFRSIFRGFADRWSGLVSFLGLPVQHTHPHKSACEAWRDDWRRIGGEMQMVVDRVHAKRDNRA